MLGKFRLAGTVGRALLVWLVAAISAPAQQPSGNIPPRYQQTVQALDGFIKHEVANKRLPAMSIALVDGQEIVWAAGFGQARPQAKVAATADTVYRVGSVSKLFTDIAVMQLVEKGELDLDAPVTQYLPDFRPENTYEKPVTLRHLMAHRAGLVREPPVGHYFDSTAPPLAPTVESLNQTSLLFSPGERIKYSNAGIAVVGFLLERTQKEPFAKLVKSRVLDPLGMKNSSFEATDEIKAGLAEAIMWTYHGREFPAPTFELGMAPAGCMYSTVTDLGRFLIALFNGGRGPNGQLLRAATVEEMWKPQFAKSEDKTGFGLGFLVTEFEGRRRVGHGGAIYGFATEVAALPEDKLGVVVVTSCDCANAVAVRIADVALRHMLAVKQDKPLPHIAVSQPLDAEQARWLAGRYRTGEKTLDLVESAGRTWVLPKRGGFRAELRSEGTDLITDDRLEYGTRMIPEGDNLRIGKDEWVRVETPRPAPPPERWRKLIGEYGWDHNVLYILEKEGQLYALIEWFFLYPLKEVSDNVFAFPDFGLYHDEKLFFQTNQAGEVDKVIAANVAFPRRKLQGEDGATFKIRPVRPLEDLRREALSAKPPPPRGELAEPDLVDLATLHSTIKLDIRYATTNNFLSTPFYTSAKAYLQRPAAEALVRVHRKLADQGYGLVVFDGYRPWHVTKMFWDATPADLKIFVANPEHGSRHNRGCAVDLSLYELKTGTVVDMPGGYDEMSDRSYPDYLGGTSLQRWHRDLLRRAMEAEGFTVYEAEWWHFDYKDWKKYPIGNYTFEEIGAKK
jgi:serine beta-lactamase-like protein LACTB